MNRAPALTLILSSTRSFALKPTRTPTLDFMLTLIFTVYFSPPPPTSSPNSSQMMTAAQEKPPTFLEGVAAMYQNQVRDNVLQ